MARKPTLSVDFDGVLHSYMGGWLGPTEIRDPIVPGALDFLKEADRFFTIAIYSTRSAGIDGRLAMQQWLYDRAREEYGADLGGDVGWLERITFPEHKPPATVHLDDRAWCFDGHFPDPAILVHFKPWNKR